MTDLRADNSISTPRGFRPSAFYVLHGARFIWANRVLWKYASAPLFISSVILGTSYVILYHWFFKLMQPYAAQEWYWRAMYYAIALIVTLLLLVVFFFLFTRIASALAAPFNEMISQKTEEIVKGTFHDEPFSFFRMLKDSGRSVAHSFKILGAYLFFLAGGLLLLLIPGIGALLYSVASALLSSYLLAYEYLGYPMDRRRLTFSEKMKFLRSRLVTTMGFGLGNLAVASIPLVNVLFIPAAVAGGTLLFLELEDSSRR